MARIVRPEDILLTKAGTPEAEQAEAAKGGLYVFGYPTPLESLTMVREAVRPLLDAGVTLKGFSVLEIHEKYYLVKFVKALKVLKSINDTQVMKELIEEAIKSNIIDVAMDIPFQPLMKFCGWLKSKAGQQAIHTVYYRRKLQKKAENRSDEAFLDTLKQLLEMYENLAKEGWSRYDVKIAELKRQIEIKERQIQKCGEVEAFGNINIKTEVTKDVKTDQKLVDMTTEELDGVKTDGFGGKKCEEFDDIHSTDVQGQKASSDRALRLRRGRMDRPAPYNLR